MLDETQPLINSEPTNQQDKINQRNKKLKYGGVPFLTGTISIFSGTTMFTNEENADIGLCLLIGGAASVALSWAYFFYISYQYGKGDDHHHRPTP